MEHSAAARPPDSEVCALLAHWELAAATVPGTVSAVLRTHEGAIAHRHADVMHYAASTVKLAVVIAALGEIASGRLDLTTELEIGATFPSQAGGLFAIRRTDDQDEATWAQVGGRVPAATLLERIVTDSSNIATNVVIDKIGFSRVRRTICAAHAEGITVDRLIGDDRGEASGRTNTVTAKALAQLLCALAAGALLPAAETQRALRALARQKHRRMIPAGLPADTWSASKGGWNAAVKHDVALVRPVDMPPYVLAICTTTSLDAAAEQLVARLSAITWEHWTAWHAS